MGPLEVTNRTRTIAGTAAIGGGGTLVLRIACATSGVAPSGISSTTRYGDALIAGRAILGLAAFALVTVLAVLTAVSAGAWVGLLVAAGSIVALDGATDVDATEVDDEVDEAVVAAPVASLEDGELHPDNKEIGTSARAAGIRRARMRRIERVFMLEQTKTNRHSA